MAIDYDDPEKSYELFKKGKIEGTWDPVAIDLEQDVADWEEFTEEERERFLGISSGFYEGEEDVTRTLAPYMVALEAFDDEEAPFDTVQEEMYLSQQVYEEAKHTDFFSRYFETVAGTQDLDRYQTDTDDGGYSIKDLYERGDELIELAQAGDQQPLAYKLGEAYLEYMGIVEAQSARGGYMVFDQIVDIKADQMGRNAVLPGFQDGIAKVRQDETRHIENGRWVLAKLAEYDPDIVTEVYEPRMQAYLHDQLLTDDRPDYDRTYEGFDGKTIFVKSQRFLQDTIDYIGVEKFDELTDVESEVRETLAAAD